jgi:hypothetical protein
MARAPEEPIAAGSPVPGDRRFLKLIRGLGSLNTQQGAGDGEGAKAVEPRSEEAETTKAGTQCDLSSSARRWAGGPRAATG